MWVYGGAQWKNLFYPPTYSESVYPIFGCFVLLEDWAYIRTSVMMRKASRLIFSATKSGLNLFFACEWAQHSHFLCSQIQRLDGWARAPNPTVTHIYRVVSIVTRLQGVNWGFVNRLPQVKEFFLLSKASRPACGPNQLSVHWLHWALFQRTKWSGREADNSLLSDVKVKSEWSYTSTFLYPSMICIGATL